MSEDPDINDRSWSPQQEEALDAIEHWRRDPSAPQIFRLFGYAGTGKTTIAVEIYRACNALACAFTGKAASVMASKGLTNARTVHSLIYNPVDKDGKQLKELEHELELLEKVSRPTKSLLQRMEAVRRALREAKAEHGRPQFTLKEASDIQSAALVILDEASMVDERMAEDLLSFGTKILVIGDPAQLPPVKGTGYFTNARPDYLLTEIHRQAAGSPIIRLATAVREGRSFSLGNWNGLSIVNRIDAQQALDADQVLCGTNNRRRSINLRHRQLLGHDKGGPMPRASEKLVCLKNNRELGLLNGTLWDAAEHVEWFPGDDQFLLSVYPNGLERIEGMPPQSFPVESCIFLDEDNKPMWGGKGEQFTYGYALTVHKSQGSQWDKVILFGQDWRQQSEDYKNWLYTGVTRAAEHLTVVMG